MHIFCAEKYCYSTQILNNHIRFWNRHIKACNVRVSEQVREPCISLLRCDVIMISFVKNCPLNILTTKDGHQLGTFFRVVIFVQSQICVMFFNLLGVTRKPAGQSEYLSSPASQPGILRVISPQKTKKNTSKSVLAQKSPPGKTSQVVDQP